MSKVRLRVLDELGVKLLDTPARAVERRPSAAPGGPRSEQEAAQGDQDTELDRHSALAVTVAVGSRSKMPKCAFSSSTSCDQLVVIIFSVERPFLPSVSTFTPHMVLSAMCSGSTP